MLKRTLLLPTAMACFMMSCSNQASENSVTFIGAQVFDGTGRAVIEDAVLVVKDGRIDRVGTRESVAVPKGGQRIDLSGKYIIPGFINAHGHVGDTVGLESGRYSGENVLRQLALYARYGITAVNSLGGDQEAALAIRDSQDTPDLNRARLYFAGAVVTGDTPEEAVAMVKANAEMKVNTIKIRVDDNLGTSKKMTPETYQAVIAEAHKLNLPVAAHLFYLEDAKGLLKAGVDFVAHSVRDREIDEELISLLKENDIGYCPTLAREVTTFVYESVPPFFDDPFFLREADPEVIKQLKDPERQEGIRSSRSAQLYKKALDVASMNLKQLADAGAKIAFGTDTGPPGRFQGFYEHIEMELMAKAGLSPEQILIAGTRDAAGSLGLAEIGTLEKNKWADFVVLTADPLADIKNVREIESVWIAGNRVPEAPELTSQK